MNPSATFNAKSKQGTDVVGFLYRISLLFLLCQGAQTWFTWNLPASVVYFTISLIAFLYKMQKGIKVVWSTSLIIGILAGLITWTYINWSWKYMAIITFIIQFYPLLILKYDTQINKTISFLAKGLCIIFIPD